MYIVSGEGYGARIIESEAGPFQTLREAVEEMVKPKSGADLNYGVVASFTINGARRVEYQRVLAAPRPEEEGWRMLARRTAYEVWVDPHLDTAAQAG